MQGIALSVAGSRNRLRRLTPVARHALAVLAFSGLGALAGAGGALAQPAPAAQGAYEFAAPPSAQANRVYGLNRQTGEMNVCQFERPEGSAVGITHCFAQGEGAGPQKAGSYALAPTHYEGETGIFRVNRDTGEMSICYVRETARPQGGADSSLVCTPAAR